MTAQVDHVPPGTHAALPAKKRRRVRDLTVADLVLTPAVLLSVLAALYLYLQGQELDEIEQRSINWATISRLLVEHVQLVAVSSLLVIIIAVPMGVLLTRPALRHATTPVLAVANLGQAVPSIGVLVLLAVTVGTGFRMAIIALVLVAFLSVLRNTIIGITGVDRSLIEAARGMGLTKTAVLFTVELPLSIPVMLAGIRVALILNVGNAALASFTNAGGLGSLIQTGIALNRMPVLLTGCVLAAVLALALDWLAGIVERVLRPPGL
ncbi:ABC transporter permease [Phytoactinopolyspora mesophila]|uniref:ABC transporter permease subunit n=1 Tax=Phytoactinopolyspora mesophila TaxID=2650750 RepID=A0A7K3M3X4_9ACTN|nr:ABC transporter permease [Phytoactinopolyspora mesophila]NDL57946.1 ABC transporter permease subunit [Phytoactinopolyspora mesophila]